jgi:hypothetical protein
MVVTGASPPLRQADALDINAQAKRRLADEYNAAQARGEVQKRGDSRSLKRKLLPSASDLGLTTEAEYRQIRDAERRDPGIVRRTVDAVKAGKEPTATKAFSVAKSFLVLSWCLRRKLRLTHTTPSERSKRWRALCSTATMKSYQPSRWSRCSGGPSTASWS